jgi:hypothetical protein
MNDLPNQIAAEIKRVQTEIEDQKRLIKASVKKKLVVETAEQEMKALHTRLAVLEANLVKESTSPERPGPARPAATAFAIGAGD